MSKTLCTIQKKTLSLQSVTTLQHADQPESKFSHGDVLWVLLSFGTTMHHQQHSCVSIGDIHTVRLHYGPSTMFTGKTPTPCWSILDFWKIKFEKSISTNWIFTACVACKNPVHRTWFFKLDFSEIKYRSTGGEARPLLPFFLFNQTKCKDCKQ